jgi:general secretion pathway protein D
VFFTISACNSIAQKKVFDTSPKTTTATATESATSPPTPAPASTQTATVFPTKAPTQTVTRAPVKPVQQEVIMDTPQMGVEESQKIVDIGSGQYISSSALTIDTSLTAADKKVVTEEGDITLNFQGTDIREFIKVILGDVLNVNYVIDQQVGGSVTIDTAIPIQEKELFPLLENVLAMNNAAIIKSDGIYNILPKSKVVRGNLAPTTATKQTGNGYNVRIVPLTFIAAQEMQKILEPFVTEGGEIRVDKRRNLLILGGTADELNTLQETIGVFDVDWMRGMSVGLYPLDYVDPKTLKTELDSILVGAEGSARDELLDGLVRTIAIERLNSILLISATPAALYEAETWVERLDIPGEAVGQRLYVYNVQNAKATEIADILGNIFGSSSSESAFRPPDAQLAPGTTPVEITGSEGEGETKPRGAVSVGDSGVALSSMDSIEIIADDTRNALVILATPQDYKMVLAAVQKLDIVPLQVLIEASILEVALTDDLEYGVEWFFKNNFDDDKQGQGQLNLTGLGPLTPGFSYTIVDNAANVRVALNALASESDLNILSSPSLMVLDNQTAKINVGKEVPVPTRQSVSNIDPNAPSVNEIQYRDTGVILEVTPRVNNSGLVTMEIRQEVSTVDEQQTSGIDAPTFTQREIESTVAINSGETIILGGLIENDETNIETGIPGLHNIPLIGNLFGTTVDNIGRRELLVLITPRVVRNNADARQITDEFRSKLRRLPPIKVQP